MGRSSTAPNAALCVGVLYDEVLPFLSFLNEFLLISGRAALHHRNYIQPQSRFLVTKIRRCVNDRNDALRIHVRVLRLRLVIAVWCSYASLRLTVLAQRILVYA